MQASGKIVKIGKNKKKVKKEFERTEKSVKLSNRKVARQLKHQQRYA